jgi:hypothetical protein
LYSISDFLSTTCCLVLVIGFCSTLFSQPGLLEDGSIDKKLVRDYYFEGDFDEVKKTLEAFRKNNPDAAVHDLAFVYKYLGVVYAADQETRQKAESYLFQMLKLMPKIDLADMYVSEQVEDIFQKVKKRHQEMHPDQQADSSPDKDASQKETQDSPTSKRWIWWTAGGVGVAAMVTGFLLLSSEEKAEKQTLPPVEL